MKNQELREFAADVRKQAHKMLCAANVAKNDRILELAGALCTQAAQVEQRAAMTPSAENPERYDLSTLPALSAFDE